MNKNKFYPRILTFFLLFSSLLSLAKVRERAKTRTEELFTGNCIAWDLHDVLFFEKPSLFKSFWYHPHKRNLFPTGKMKKVVWREIKRAFFGSDTKRLNSTELIEYAKKYDCPDIAEFVIHHETSCVPDPDMVALIKALHEQGYRQFICSNISEQGMSVLKERFPEVFVYFEDTYTTQKGNSRKPHRPFYTSCLNQCGLKPGEVLFIDDKWENCVSAEQMGMQVIHFKGTSKKQRKESISTIQSKTKKTSHKRTSCLQRNDL